MFSTDDITSLRKGDRRTLARMITFIESSRKADRADARELLDAILPFTGNALRIGISGTPGVGKSTFIDAFGSLLLNQGKRVAVLAVDPSSPISGGSLLGDKTRMERLSQSPSAFVRPSPSLGEMGGVAEKTREAMLLCEAANFDIILIETVGVGQSEYDVHSMVDIFVLLMQPSAGDELQGIKKGILELADLLLVNKADGDSLAAAQQTEQYCRNALAITRKADASETTTLSCSALEELKLDQVYQSISEFVDNARASGNFDVKRSSQNRAWMDKLLLTLVKEKIECDEDYQQLKNELEQAVAIGEINTMQAAKKLAERFYR